MTVLDLVRALRNRWQLTAIVIVAGVLLGLITTLVTPNSYASSATLYISAQSAGSGNTAVTAYQGSLLSEQRVASYTQLAGSERVSSDAVKLVGSPLTGAQLSREVSVSAQPNTVLLTITVEDASPTNAALLANGVADAFTRLVAELEQPLDRTQPPAVVARVVEPAVAVSAPVSPSLTLNVGLGLLVGVVLGTGIAVILTVTDNKVRDRDALAQLSSSASLGETFRDDTTGNTPDPFHLQTSREQYRQIRTNMQFVAVDRESRIIAVSSPNAAEGKTTTVANLGRVFADAGYRVLLVDADLRKPRLAHDLGLETDVGLSSVLAGRVDIAGAIQRLGSFSCDVLPAGRTPPNPSELLSSQAMRTIIGRFRETYDIVLLDSAPVLPVADAAALSAQCDGVMLVARYGKTKRADVSRAVESLTKASGSIVGTILTVVPPTRGDSSYYGYGRPVDESSATSLDPDTETVSTIAAPQPPGGADGNASGSPRPTPNRRI